MSPALTKNEYGVMVGKKKKKKKNKEKKPSQGQNWKRACEKKVLNESEPQEARRCKGWESSIIL